MYPWTQETYGKWRICEFTPWQESVHWGLATGTRALPCKAYYTVRKKDGGSSFYVNKERSPRWITKWRKKMQISECCMFVCCKKCRKRDTYKCLLLNVWTISGGLLNTTKALGFCGEGNWAPGKWYTPHIPQHFSTTWMGQSANKTSWSTVDPHTFWCFLRVWCCYKCYRETDVDLELCPILLIAIFSLL